MKKLRILFLSALTVLSLAACSGTPSDEKIKAALEDGTITVEDAKAKGWIDDTWMKANFEQIDAETKIYLFDEFNTTYLDGTPTTSQVIAGKMCLVFFNTEQEGSMEKLEVYKEISPELQKIGVPVLGIIMDADPGVAKEKLADMPFPIIVYNEEMQTSLEKYKELLDGDVISVFTKEGGFYSAWNSTPESKDLLRFAQSLADEK